MKGKTNKAGNFLPLDSAEQAEIDRLLTIAEEETRVKKVVKTTT